MNESRWYKFKDVVNNIAWTSMGDRKDETYNEPMITGAWNDRTQVSFDKTLLLQGSDSEKIYTRNTWGIKTDEIILNNCVQI